MTGRGTFLAALALAGLSGCADVPMPPVAAPPEPRDVAPPAPVILPASSQTVAAQAYYRRIEAAYLSQGQLRIDAGGVDAPFDADDLVENFTKIAFYDEFTEVSGKLVARPSPTRLHRWEGPVRVALEFGPSVSAAQRSRDKADTAALLARLSRLTGLSMTLSYADANYFVLIANPDERQMAAARVKELAPRISAAALNSIAAMKPEIYCTVIGMTPGRSAVYERAVAVIRAELPDRMRRACLHEEIVQGLGLVNDSPEARPSIFNDAEEFALLTRHDELLLRMLYDRRLRAGMTAEEARPILAVIAAELMGSAS